jgi:hypothetical protein
MRTRAQHWFADAERARQFMEPLAFGRAAKPGEIALMLALLASGFERLILEAILIAYATGCTVTIGVHARLWLRGEYRGFPRRIAFMSIIMAAVFWPGIQFFLVVRKKL